MDTVRFASHGSTCEGWWLPATSSALDTAAGRPCVVMAHGFGTTRDSALLPFAQRFAEVGCDVLLFDYRGFGGSEAPRGAPRQDVDHRRHREDYHAAVTFARAHTGTDPDRVALWGTSYSGGHVVVVAAQDPRVAAVISQGAAVDGLAALTGRGKKRDPEVSTPAAGASGTTGKGRALAGAVLDDAVRRLLRRPPRLVPFLGPPGSTAMMSGPGADAFAAMTGPTFRNEMCARGLLRIARNRPIRHAADVRCPVLLVVAEYDEIAPSTSVHHLAELLGDRAEVAAYDCAHFDLYAGPPSQDSQDRQVAFLQRVLG